MLNRGHLLGAQITSAGLQSVHAEPGSGCFFSAEPLSPGPDSEATMEVDCDLNSDGGQSMDEQDEPSTPEDKLFFIEGPCADADKDDETIRAIR